MALVQSWFTDPYDKAFVGMVAVKLARLGVLLSSNKIPNNESVEDSFLDLSVYCCLWAANRKRRGGIESKVENKFLHRQPEAVSDRSMRIPLEPFTKG
jgi:hypothetical protein